MTKPRRVEEFYYRDEGCQFAPSCLRCPLPRCKYDAPAAPRELRRLAAEGLKARAA